MHSFLILFCCRHRPFVGSAYRPFVYSRSYLSIQWEGQSKWRMWYRPFWSEYKCWHPFIKQNNALCWQDKLLSVIVRMLTLYSVHVYPVVLKYLMSISSYIRPCWCVFSSDLQRAESLMLLWLFCWRTFSRRTGRRCASSRRRRRRPSAGASSSGPQRYFRSQSYFQRRFIVVPSS